MHSNPMSKGRWHTNRPTDSASTPGYNSFGADRGDASSFHPPGSQFNGSQFNVNQSVSGEARGGTAAASGGAGRSPQGSLRPRYPESHSSAQGTGFQHNVPLPRHATVGAGPDGACMALPPPRSVQIMAAGSAATPNVPTTFATRVGPAAPMATHWPAVPLGAALPAQPQNSISFSAGGSSSAAGNLYSRLSDPSPAKTGLRDGAALSYAVSDGDGTRSAIGSGVLAPTLGCPSNLNAMLGGAAHGENANEMMVSVLLQRIEEGNDRATAPQNTTFIDPSRAESHFDAAVRREPSSFAFTTSSDFSTALYPSGLGSPGGAGAVSSLSVVPNAFSTRPDASAPAGFHSPFSTSTAPAAVSGNTAAFSLSAGGREDTQSFRSGLTARPLDSAATAAFKTGSMPLQRPPQFTTQNQFSGSGFQNSDEGELSEGEGLLDFRAVLGSPSAEPEDSPTMTLETTAEHHALHADLTAAEPYGGAKLTMAEALFKHSAKPTNANTAALNTSTKVDTPAAAPHATGATSGNSTGSSAKPTASLVKTAASTPAHHDSREHATAPAVPAPRSAERAGVPPAARATTREENAYGTRPAVAPQNPPTPGATRPQRLPLESPTVTRHNIVRLFRDSPQSLRHREITQHNRQKPTALHAHPQWPPKNAAEVEALLKKTNASKLLRHLAIICFSRQNVKGMQELFDTWTRNGIPAPDLCFGAYYYYVKERSDKLLCMKHNGRGATPGHGYGKCDFESRRPNSTCRYEHVCLFCRSREHGWFEESRCEGYQQLLAEVERLGVSEDDLEVMLDAMEKSVSKQSTWTRRL